MVIYLVYIFYKRKICSFAQSFISEGTKFQILGLIYDNIFVLYNTVFTLYERTFTSDVCGTLASLNNSHITFGAIRCLTLYLSRASFLMFQ